MKAFTITKSIWDAIRSAQLSDKDTMSLIRYIMQQAFGGDGPLPQLGKATRPMAFLICEMIGAESEPAALPTGAPPPALPVPPADAAEETEEPDGEFE